MKTTGITRKIDELGRIVLPVELRKQFGIEERDPIEIYVEGDRIILKKKKEACIFCGKSTGLVSYKDHMVCKACIEELSK